MISQYDLRTAAEARLARICQSQFAEGRSMCCRPDATTRHAECESDWAIASESAVERLPLSRRRSAETYFTRQRITYHNNRRARRPNPTQPLGCPLATTGRNGFVSLRPSARSEPRRNGRPSHLYCVQFN